MSYIDLKRRRRRALEAALPDSAPKSVDEVSTANAELAQVEETPTPVDVEAEAPRAVASVDHLMVPQTLALGMLSRSHEVLVAGAGPWGEPEWIEALSARTRAVTILDADRTRLTRLRAYCREAQTVDFSKPDWTGKLGSSRYSAALVSTALSHQADPVGFLKQVRELLTPEGVLIAIVPNVTHGETRLGLLSGEYPRDFESDAPRHRYTRARLRELLAFAGYAVADVQEFEKALFTDESALVPESFPASLLRAIATDDDVTTSHFVIKAVPATPEALLRTLFDEQSNLKRAVRNELAKASRTHDALTERLKEADERIEELVSQVSDAQHFVKSSADAVQRAEHNVRRLESEAELARLELQSFKHSLTYRLIQFFRPKPKPDFTAMDVTTEPDTWRYDEG